MSDSAKQDLKRWWEEQQKQAKDFFGDDHTIATRSSGYRLLSGGFGMVAGMFTIFRGGRYSKEVGYWWHTKPLSRFAMGSTLLVFASVQFGVGYVQREKNANKIQQNQKGSTEEQQELVQTQPTTPR